MLPTHRPIQTVVVDCSLHKRDVGVCLKDGIIEKIMLMLIIFFQGY